MQEPESLALGLAGAAGISGMSSTLVPPMLLDGRGGRSILMNVASAEHLGRVQIDEAWCDHLRIVIPGYPGQPELWIDDGGFLRQYRESQVITGDTVTTTISLRPEVDAPIDPAVFAFTPPAGSGVAAPTRLLLAILIVGGLVAVVGVWVIARRVLEVHFAMREEWSPRPDDAATADDAALPEPEPPAPATTGPDEERPR